jgi:hypothetical protein
MQYPIPIILEPAQNWKKKRVYKTFLIDNQEAGILYFKLRKLIKLSKEESIFLFCTDLLITCST